MLNAMCRVRSLYKAHSDMEPNTVPFNLCIPL